MLNYIEYYHWVMITRFFSHLKALFPLLFYVPNFIHKFLKYSRNEDASKTETYFK